jgi:hypothetical protein
MIENSAVFFFVSTVLNFASTVLNFASTVFFFVSTVLNHRQGGVRSYVTIAPPPPPACMHVYLGYSGGGGEGEP